MSETNNDVKKRYLEKIKLCENEDPYSIDIESTPLVLEDLPNVKLFDLWNYLIMTKSTYTGEPFNAYKGLEGHKFLDSGFVRKVVAKLIPNNKRIVIGLVDHSMQINLVPLKPWVLCALGGTILAAHCNCIAGLGEVCSHVAALLYTVETMVRSIDNQSKTDVLCEWNHPTSSRIVRALPLCEMNFAKKERISGEVSKFPLVTKTELFDWIKENKERTKNTSHLALVIPGLNEDVRTTHLLVAKPKASQGLIGNVNTDCDFDRIILQSLVNIYYKPEYKGLTLEELLKVSKSIEVKLSETDIQLIESMTKQQTNSWLWEKLRVGRVTASTLKRVCRTSLKKPAKSTIMDICYPEKTRFYSRPTDYGKKWEEIARNSFIKKMNGHQNFTCRCSGLIIDALCNFFAVSPDGICECSCCGKYLVEIKCPSSLAQEDSTIDNLLNLKDAYVIKENDSLVVNKKHQYYYQLQMQMAVCHVKFAYLFIWSRHFDLNLPVEFDQNFWNENSLKAFQFAKVVLIPELMNSFYTKTYA